MPGIRVDSPTGEDWEYSLDNETWQTSTRFITQTDGTPFEVGVLYTVFCRNLTQEKTALERIVFGRDSNDLADLLALQQVIFNDPTATSTPVFEGGIIATLPDEPEGSQYPETVQGPDGMLYVRRAATVVPVDPTIPTPPVVPVPNFIIFGHYIEREPDKIRVTAPHQEWQGVIGETLTNVFRIVGPDKVIGTKATYRLEEEVQDANGVKSFRSYTNSKGAVAWSTNVNLQGISMSSISGELDATAYELPVTNIQVNAAITGELIAKSITLQSNALVIVKGTYGWQKNKPPTTASGVDVFVQINKSASIIMAIAVDTTEEPPAFAYFDMDQTGTLERYINLPGPGTGNTVTLFFREKTTNRLLLTSTLPAFPNAPNVPLTQFYPLNT